MNAQSPLPAACNRISPMAGARRPDGRRSATSLNSRQRRSLSTAPRAALPETNQVRRDVGRGDGRRARCVIRRRHFNHIHADKVDAGDFPQDDGRRCADVSPPQTGGPGSGSEGGIRDRSISNDRYDAGGRRQFLTDSGCRRRAAPAEWTVRAGSIMLNPSVSGFVPVRMPIWTERSGTKSPSTVACRNMPFHDPCGRRSREARCQCGHQTDYQCQPGHTVTA